MAKQVFTLVSRSPDIAEMMLTSLGIAFDQRVDMGDGLATVWRADCGLGGVLVATLSRCGRTLTIV